MDNPLWDFSLTVYAQDEVAPTCLTLQDEYGLDVNLLLYAAWLAHTHRRLTVEHLSALEAVIVDWRRTVLWPLRALRRDLRRYSPATAVADELESLELRAEQHQQQLMYTFSQQTGVLPQADWSLQDNLTLVAQIANPEHQAWQPAIRRLASLLPQ